MTAYLVCAFILFLLIIFVIDRSIKLRKLKDQTNNLEEQLKKYKSNHEEFSLGLQRMNLKTDPNEEFTRDPLTNLLGRQAFEDRLAQLLNQSKRFDKSFGVMMLNIDDFEAINKNYGYEAGDKVLKEAASRLKLAIRQVDTIIRYAGDSFVFLLPNLSMPETAVYAAQRLLDTLVATSFKIDDKEIVVTACIGIAIFPHDGEEAQSLMRNVEIALHTAKKSGKNLYQFYQQETHLLGQRELSLKTCVTSNEFLQKLSLEYQFYINTLTNEEICMQAIPVLNHSELGAISFSDFARIVENSGKIEVLYEWLIKMSGTYFKKIQTPDNYPKHLILTFTVKQIQNIQFLNKLVDLLATINIKPEELIIEIKDDMEGADPETIRKSFTLLNEAGIQIAVGILGLGNFALKKVNNLPINYLKVDDKLIRDIDTHLESKNILERIIFLTNSMEIGVLTEGVEKEEQKNILQALGCYVMQGGIFKRKTVSVV